MKKKLFLLSICCLLPINLVGCIKNEPTIQASSSTTDVDMNDSLNGTGNESSDVNVDVNSEEDKITSSDTMESDTINFIFDGVPVKIKDSKGDDAEAFISGGTVYIPATAVGEAVGKAVTYDGTSKTLYIGTNPNIKNYLFNVCPPTDGSYTEYTGGKTFEMRGKKYTNGFTLYSSGYVIIPLEGEYSSITMKIGHIDGTLLNPGSFTVTLDGVSTGTVYEFNPEDPVQDVTISLNGALTLRIDGNIDIHRYGFAEVELK